MRIILVRHAEKIKDEFHSELSKKGIKQAEYLSKRLSKIKIDEFYCSELPRARQTAEIVSKKIKLKPKIEESLNEYETISMRTNFKKASIEEKNRFSRLKKFLKKITKNPYKDKTILIIAHGFTNRIIFSQLMNIEIKKLLPFKQRETSFIDFFWQENYKNWGIEVWNDYSHLPENLK